MVGPYRTSDILLFVLSFLYSSFSFLLSCSRLPPIKAALRVERGPARSKLRELLLIQWSSLDTNGPPVLSGVLVTVELRTLADYQGSSLRAFCQAGEGYWESNLVEWGLCPG